MKVDLRKFRFWYISQLIKGSNKASEITSAHVIKAYTRKTANYSYNQMKKDPRYFELSVNQYLHHIS